MGRGFPIGWVIAAVLLVGVLLAVIGAYVTEDANDKTYRLQFERIAHSYSTALETGITANLNELHALGSFFDSSNEITREEFHSFVSSILARHHATIQALQWVPRVRAGARARFEAAVRAAGEVPDFSIVEGRVGQVFPAARRPVSFPVLYAEPPGDGASPLGLDLAADARLAATLARARDSGVMLATAPMDDVEGGAFGRAFLVLQPLYAKGAEHETVEARRVNLTGFVVGVFQVGELIGRSTDLRIDDPIVSHLHIFVYDRSLSGNEQLLYSRQIPNGNTRDPAAFWSYRREIPVAGRTWLVDFRLDPATQALPGAWIFRGTLLAGLVGTGMLVALLLVMANRTRESQRAAQAIRKSEERFRDFAEVAADMFWETDENHRIIDLSAATAPSDPERRDAARGPQADGPLGDPGKILETLYIHLESHEAFRDLQSALVRETDGRVFYVRNSGKPIFDETGAFRGFRGTAIDVTEQRDRELQLRHYQKMEAVGQLTGGLAHDLNNVLNIISMNLGMLEELGPDDPQRATCVEAADRAITRAADLTRKLLDFSRKDVKGAERVSVNTFIRGMESLIAKSVTPKIAVRMELAEDAWLVKIDPGNLEDAILNLALNARDAMPDGGALTIETANKTIDESYVYRNPGGIAGDFVMISVSDTGAGMTPEIAGKAFEPFFTTKEVGKGTGLGLSMVYGFVKRSGGHAKIYSEAGLGTTVRLYLPRASGTGRDEPPALPDREKLPRGTETVLVVDDEAELVKVAVTFLRSLGYRTLAAGNAAEAMAMLRDVPSIDLLFSDVIMPGGKDGYRLALEALEERPDLRILLTSGFSRRREELANGADRTAAVLAKTLLDKPYNIVELAAAVRRALDMEGPAG